MKLADLLAQLPGARAGTISRRQVNAAGELRGITPHLRDVRPGMAYLALPSAVQTNPFTVHAACARGAAVVICDPEVAVPARATTVRVADPRAALAAAAAAFRAFPANHLKLYAVTGEAAARRGIAAILTGGLNALGISTATFGSSGFGGVGRRTHSLPGALDSVEVQGLLRQHVAVGGRCVVVEYDDAAPADGLIGLNFARRIVANRSTGFQHLRPLLLHARGSRVEYLGTAKAQVATTPLVGRRSLLALDQVWPELVAVAVEFGFPIEAVRKVLPILPPVSGWLEPVTCGQAAGVWVDGGTEALGLTAALRDARELVRGRLHVVLGARAAATSAQNAGLGAAALALADEVHATADNPRHRSVAELNQELWLSASAVPPAAPMDRARAIRQVLRRLRSGDGVVLAGKADAPVQEIGDVIVPCDDRWIAAEVLAAQGYPGGGR